MSKGELYHRKRGGVPLKAFEGQGSREKGRCVAGGQKGGLKRCEIGGVSQGPGRPDLDHRVSMGLPWTGQGQRRPRSQGRPQLPASWRGWAGMTASSRAAGEGGGAELVGGGGREAAGPDLQDVGWGRAALQHSPLCSYVSRHAPPPRTPLRSCPGQKPFGEMLTSISLLP